MKLSLAALAAAVAVLFSAGCQDHPAKPADASARATTINSDDDGHDANFKGTGVLTRNVFAAQRDAGAARDATLHAADFDGDALNGLGRDKLAAIIRGWNRNPAVPLTVYLHDGNAGPTSARYAAVAAALIDAGVPADHAKLIAGPNPNEAHLASLTESAAYKSDHDALVPGDATASGNISNDAAGGAGTGQPH